MFKIPKQEYTAEFKEPSQIRGSLRKLLTILNAIPKHHTPWRQEAAHHA